jgi:NMD protein affecting ribosome stability and mRNA decay
MYLWCSRCLHATAKISWTVTGAKHGVCPICGSSQYRNAVEWSVIAAANGYRDQPVTDKTYPLQPVLF